MTGLCGSAANGIFSVAYKIPSLMMVFQTIFNQAWTISAVKSQEDGKDDFYSRVYSVYNLGFVILCSCIILSNKVVAKFLFSNDFYEAWKFAPFLIITVIFNSLAGLLGGILVARKKTNLIATTTMSGAIVNLILNLILVGILGPLGAAIGSLVSYIVVWGCRLYKTIKLGEISVKIKDNILSYIILVIQATFMLIIKEPIVMYVSQVVCLLIIIMLYLKDIVRMIYQMRALVASKR